MTEKRTTLHALKWSTLGHILPQAVNPLITIYIARLLCPEAYGIIAIATIVISFLQLFLSQGFTTALIQKQGNKKEVYRTADFIFSFNLIMSSIFYLIILISSSAIAQFFHNPEAKTVISILSLGIVIHAFGDVQLAMLQKNMDFKSIFYRQIVPVLSNLMVTLPLASLGYGVWALVAGKLVSDILAAIILWWKSEWKPKFNFSFKENAGIIRFGLFMILSSLMAWGISQGDNLIVGKFLTTKELGLYRTGFDLDARIFNLFLASLAPVLYSKFCTINSNEDKRKYYMKVKKYISMLVFPIIAGLILVSGYFDNLILGDKWKGISFIMAILALNPGIGNLWNLLPAFLKSLGKPQIITVITIIYGIIYLPLLLIFVRYGLKTFVIVRASLGIVGLVANTYFENRELRIDLSQALKFYYKPFIASIVMFVFGFFIHKYAFHNNYTWFSLFVMIISSIAIYISIILIISKKEFISLKNTILKERVKTVTI